MNYLKKSRDFLLTYLILLFDRTSALCCKKIKSHHPKLLLVRVDYIGDFIIWLDTAKYFRQHYPHHHITLAVYEPCAPLSERFPYWDEIWPLNLKKFRYNPLYRFQFLKRVRQSGFEIAIQPTHSRAFFCGDAIIRASDAKERIGSTGDYSNIIPWRKRISDRWYTRLIFADSQIEIKRNSDFINRLFSLTSRTGISHLPILSNIREEVHFKQPYYVFFPGASSGFRRWPFQNFIELSAMLHQKTGWLGVACGGRDESFLCEKIVENASSPMKNIAGQTTLLELIEIIRRSALFIGNETSGIHIAAATRTPSVCILGGGQPGRFLPYVVANKENEILPMPVIHAMSCFGCDWRCKHPTQKGLPFLCIDQITVQNVIKAVNNLFTIGIIEKKLKSSISYSP